MSKKDDLETPENEELGNNGSAEMASSDEERENVAMDADGEESELSDDDDAEVPDGEASGKFNKLLGEDSRHFNLSSLQECMTLRISKENSGRKKTTNITAHGISQQSSPSI